MQDNKIIEIEPGLSETYFIKYKQNTIFNFALKAQESLQINIHSINCNFEVSFNGEMLNRFTYDTYSFIINSENSNITIKPLIDIIDGQYKKNYEQKSCPLSINSFLINVGQPEIKIKNKEENFLYLDHSKYNSLNISYNIKEVVFDSFVDLYFQYNEKTNISIDITYQNDKNQINSISKNIYDTHNIFLNSEFLLYENESNTGGNLSIRITNIDEKTINMRFKVIEKNTISLLEKDYLNFGFLTSKTTYQYFYTEIFMGEEGEFMLHNKRIYGKLYAKIVNKSETSIDELNNPSFYPNETKVEDNSIYLYYHEHSLQLKYSYENTSHCLNGCYLLITYEQNKSVGDYPLIGYEFTILTRSWNFTDYLSNIIDIPFNEYIIGAFEKGSISHHYYSLPIPDNTEKIIIQIEGNYLDGFYGEGRQKINTFKTIGNTNKLQITRDKNSIYLEMGSLNYKEKIMSFAFRPKDDYADIFSFYYFRILYVKQNEKFYYPIDSQFGNLCLPESLNNTNLYFCNLKLENNLNSLSTKFAISSSTLNEYFEINVTKVYSNGSIYNEKSQFVYDHYITNESIDYYLFQFEFRNKEIKNIITSFFDRVANYYPQIYSSQMFYLYQSEKEYRFKLKNNYLFNYIFVHGRSGSMRVDFLNYWRFWTTRNFRGKPVALPVDDKTKNITLRVSREQIIYFFQLQYNMNNKGIEEVKSGETKSQFVIGGHFPLYYYLKVKNPNYINLDVNLRVNSYNETLLQNNFGIRGHLLNEDLINRKKNGESIQLNHPIAGYYSDIFKVGLLQVNQPVKDDYNYILIEILNHDQEDIKYYLLVELITKEYNQDEYFIPINQYMLDTFDGGNNTIREENRYYLSIYQKNKDHILLEYSSGYNDIEIVFENSSNVNASFYYFKGFKKYRVYSASNDNVYFRIVNPYKRNVTYMMRYFYTDITQENNFTFNLTPEIKTNILDNEKASISLTFEGIKCLVYGKPYDDTDDIYFYIFGFLYNLGNNSEEHINTTAVLNELKPSYENQTKHFFSKENPEKWTLFYENVSRKDAIIYDLRLQINVIIEDNIFDEEFLVFTTKVDLRDIKYEEEVDYTWIILGTVLGAVALGVIIFFVVKFIRLHRKSLILEEEMKSLAYSTDVQKNVLIKEKKSSEKDTDYETTFI